MKIALTGATGFLGRHVINYLLKRGEKPKILLRPDSELPESYRELSIARFDIANPPADAFERLGTPDVLLHLAWGGLPNYKSIHHFETELPAQFRFLRLLVDAGLPHLLVSGTCLEYGMQSGCLDETAETAPANPYGFAKDALRGELQYLAKTAGFDLTWARLFYLYGEGQASSSLYVQICAAAERGDKVFDMSGGEQLRDYLPAEKAARHLVELALGSARPGTVNVCSGHPVSVRRLVEGWIAQNHWSIELNLGVFPYPDYEPLAFWGSRKKLDEALQFNGRQI